MIEFKTKMTTVSVSDTITITRKGKNPLSDKLLWILASAWIVDEDEIFLKVGAYSITIKVKNNADMVELIRRVFRNPLNSKESVTIKAESISISE
jgi:hypothetical protein